MTGISRRRFLEDSLFAAAAAAAASSTRFARAADEKAIKKVAPSDLIRVAVIGVNGRGMNHVTGFSKNENAIVAAICDTDKDVFGKAAREAVQKGGGKEPVYYQDIRKLLEDKSIDAVSIATPNHWHSLAAIWAVQAGKDVYVEKPLSHNVQEGRMLVEVARKHGRMVQTGSQSRSNPGMQQFIAAVRGGKIGKVSLARGLCYKGRKSIGKVGTPGKPPASVDYNLWLGPAPMRADVPRLKFHYDWHWQWDYGNGDLGNQGVHEMDKARWGLGKTTFPKWAFTLGGRFGYEDDGETANTQICFYDYGDCELIFEVRGLETRDLKGAKVGNIFYGSEGYAVSNSYSSGTLFDLKGEKIAHFDGSADHFGNFLKAVRSRKASDLTAPAQEGHLSAALCHLGNISYRLGTETAFSKKPPYAVKNKNAEEAYGRFLEHLADNKVPTDKGSYRLGRELTVDPIKETFVNGNRAATSQLAREPRKGFEVPNKA
jgi:predicted dehydrogenase